MPRSVNEALRAKFSKSPASSPWRRANGPPRSFQTLDPWHACAAPRRPPVRRHGPSPATATVGLEVEQQNAPKAARPWSFEGPCYQRYPTRVINFIQTRILITHHSCCRPVVTTPRTAVSVPLAHAMEEGYLATKAQIRAWLRRYAFEHARTVSPRMSVIPTKTGSKKPWPSSSARGRADWSMPQSRFRYSVRAVGNVRLPMNPGRAGTMTHDYKRDDHAVRRSERLDGAHCTCNRVGKTSSIVMNKSIFPQTRQ